MNQFFAFCNNRPNWKVEKTNMTVHITLVTRIADSGTGSILVESQGKWILACTCTKTVSGHELINEYIEDLNEEDKKEVLCCKTERKSFLRFDDGVKSKNIKTLNIPIVIVRSTCC